MHQVWRRILNVLQLFFEKCPFLFLSSNKVFPCLTLCRAGEQWLDWKSILGLGPGQVDDVSNWKSILGLGPGQVDGVSNWKSVLGLGPGQVGNVLEF